VNATLSVSCTGGGTRTRERPQGQRCGDGVYYTARARARDTCTLASVHYERVAHMCTPVSGTLTRRKHDGATLETTRAHTCTGVTYLYRINLARIRIERCAGRSGKSREKEREREIGALNLPHLESNSFIPRSLRFRRLKRHNVYYAYVYNLFKYSVRKAIRPTPTMISESIRVFEKILL